MPVEFVYFDGKGVGEQIRLLLAYGGQEFKDTRLKHEQWPEYKPKTPFGQLPFLIIDDKMYAQSLAISRYLGRKYGLAGADIEEDFLIDQNVDFLNDIRLHAVQSVLEPTEELKNKKFEEKSKLFPDLLKKLDEIIQANDGHLAAGKLTWADFVFAGQYVTLKQLMRMPDMDEQYPSFKKLYNSIMEHPKLQRHLSKTLHPTN